MLVEVWSDVVCPWCYIGKRRFAEAVRRLGDDPEWASEIEVRYRPFQLDPTAPLGSTMPAAEGYARKFGGPEQAKRIIDQVTQVAAGEGLDFHLDRAQRANTRDAHRLLWWAAETAGLDAQDALKERLLAAYFTNGEDIGDAEVLAKAAGDAGLDADEARALLASDRGMAELAESLSFAAAHEITAVPTYVIDGRFAIPGAQDPDTVAQILKRAAERPG